MDLSQFNIKFKLFGIPICIMPGFWVLCILFSPFMSMRNPSDDRPWLFGAAGWIAALLTSFLIHELGHGLAGRRYFGVDPEIALGIGRAPSGASVFGGVTTWRRSQARSISRGARAFVSASGPLAALLAAALGLALAFATTSTPIVEEVAGGASAAPSLTEKLDSTFIVQKEFGVLPVVFPKAWLVKVTGVSAMDLFIGYFTYGFFWVNVFWSVINLLPIYPLDGGQVLASFARSNRDARNSMYVSMACALLIGGVFLRESSWFASIFFFYLGFVNYQAARTLEQIT
ncbi:MAG: site-2 protease family protein [Thermoguttaceae bacterium]|jgi:stage IV sporulation protein FB